MSALDVLAAVAALSGGTTNDIAALLAAPDKDKESTSTKKSKGKGKASAKQKLRIKSKSKPSPAVECQDKGKSKDGEPCRFASPRFASPRLDASAKSTRNDSSSSSASMARDSARDAHNSSYSSLASMMARLMNTTSVPEAPRKRRRTAHLMASPPPAGSEEELVRALMDTLARRIDDELCDAALAEENADEDADEDEEDVVDSVNDGTRAKTLVLVAMNHTADALATYDDADTYETVRVAAERGAPKNASDALLLWELYRRLATGDLAGRCVVVASRSRAARAAVEVLPYLPGVTCLAAPARVELFPTVL